MEFRSAFAAGLLTGIACLAGAGDAAAGPCFVTGGFATVCLTPAGTLSPESADGYFYVGVDERAERSAGQYDWNCNACHRAFRLDPQSYAGRVHQSVFRRQAVTMAAGARMPWAGGWSLVEQGGRLCLAQGRGPARACFPEGAFAFCGTARRDVMVHAPGPIKPIN